MGLGIILAALASLVIPAPQKRTGRKPKEVEPRRVIIRRGSGQVTLKIRQVPAEEGKKGK